MLPQGLKVVDESEEVELPSRTYRVDFQNHRILGYIDSTDAIYQAIHKIFETERYAWEIYSANYGIELETLLGQSMDFVIAILESRVTQAILADDRIRRVEDFTVTQTSQSSLEASCTLITSQGNLEIREELNF